MSVRRFAAAVAAVGLVVAAAYPIVTGKVAWVGEQKFKGEQGMHCQLWTTTRLVDLNNVERTFVLNGQTGGTFYGGYFGTMTVTVTKNLDGQLKVVEHNAKESSAFAMYDIGLDDKDRALKACIGQAEKFGMEQYLVSMLDDTKN